MLCTAWCKPIWHNKPDLYIYKYRVSTDGAEQFAVLYLCKCTVQYSVYPYIVENFFKHFMGLKTWVELRLKSSAPWSVQKFRLMISTMAAEHVFNILFWFRILLHYCECTSTNSITFWIEKVFLGVCMYVCGWLTLYSSGHCEEHSAQLSTQKPRLFKKIFIVDNQ